MTIHRKIIVLSLDYDTDVQDDPASWDWAALTDQPGTTVVSAGFVGEVSGDTITDEHACPFTTTDVPADCTYVSTLDEARRVIAGAITPGVGPS